MKKKTKLSLVLSSLAIMAVAGATMAGGTYALFTSESKVNIAVNSGKVEVVATIDDFKTYSGKDLTGNVDTDELEETTVKGTFTNGGTAKLEEDNKTLTLDKMTPGDKVEFSIKVKNNSNVKTKYRTVIKRKDNDGLFEGLKITIGEDTTSQSFYGFTSTSKYKDLEVSSEEETIKVTLELPSDRGNEYQDKKCTLEYSVDAIQSNAKAEDPSDTVLSLYDKYDLIALSKYASEFYNSSSSLYTYRTFKLENDLDMSGVDFQPIRFTNWGVPLTFEGNEKTISNLTVDVYDSAENQEAGYAGLFASGHGLTVNNLTIDKANIKGTSHVGGIVGHGYGFKINKCTVKNSTIVSKAKMYSGKTSYDDGDKAGAIAGYCDEIACEIKNCIVSDCTVKGYRDVGGILGCIAGAGSIASSTISGNSINKVKLYSDRSHDYNNYGTDITKGNINDILGRHVCAYELDSSNTATNVTKSVTTSEED